VDAAVAVIARKGPQSFSLREVARRAPVSEAAPYWHFADREALLAAVAERGSVEMAKGMRRSGHEVPDKAVHPALHEAGGRTFGLLVEATTEGQAAGQVRRGDPQALAVAAWSIVHGLRETCSCWA
jgi:AcrR family transcriptional regulator